jgi:hypothetical protein
MRHPGIIASAQLSAGSGGGGGEEENMALISSGNIASPVSVLDIPIPAGPKLFKLYLHGIDMSGGGYMCAAVSTNGGSSFINDAANFDTYSLNNWQSEHSGGSVTRHGVYADDAVMVVNFATSLITDWEIDIFPGDSNYHFRMLCKGIAIGAALVAPLLGAHSFCTSATVPPTKARIDSIRFADYGSGDINSPSGSNLAAGSWTLFSVA